MKKLAQIATLTVLFGGIYLNNASAMTVKVEQGEGLSHVAKKAGCSDFASANRWQQIANENRFSNWQSLNSSLTPNQLINVNCNNNSVNHVQIQQAPVAYKAPSLSYNQDHVKQRICAYFPNECSRMIAIAYCESSMNPSAINWQDKPYPSVGVLQIMSFPDRGSINQLLDLEYNLKMAVKIRN